MCEHISKVGADVVNGSVTYGAPTVITTRSSTVNNMFSIKAFISTLTFRPVPNRACGASRRSLYARGIKIEAPYGILTGHYQAYFAE